MSDPRTATVTRHTAETRIAVSVNLDGAGACEVHTGIGMLDHLISQLARHGLFDLTVTCEGDLHIDAHHTTEDCGIALGRAFDQALGDRAGIVRMAHAIVPLDETLSLVAIDLSGRGYAVLDMPFSTPMIGTLPTELIPHFLETFAREARLNLHVQVLRGVNSHHKAEATFKALARALDQATQSDPRRGGSIPSTKGTL